MAAALPDDLQILDIHRSTAFTFDVRGRMVHESAPDQSTGRRFSFTGCRHGNLPVIRADVPEEVARELDRLVALEPPPAGAEAEPVHLDAYRELLDLDGPLQHYHGLLWVFQGPLSYESEEELVWSGTIEGDRLLARLGEAMPSSLADKGFLARDDLWEPWCLGVVDAQVASIAETVRTGPAGAEVGVDTAVGFRGRGLGVAATAGWSRHPQLTNHTCFYSTGRDNSSSRRLTERLDLRFLGSTFAVP